MKISEKERIKREKEVFEENFFDTKTGQKFQKEFNLALGIGCIALGVICIFIVTGLFFKIDDCTSEIIDSIIDIVFLIMMLWAGYFVGYFNGAFNQSRLETKTAPREVKVRETVEIKETVAAAPKRRTTTAKKPTTTKKATTTTPKRRTTKKTTESKK